MDTDDKTILRRLKRGDAAALEAAVRHSTADMYRL